MGSITYLLFLSVTPQDEWRLHDLLPELAKPFTLYVTEKDKVAMGVMSQTLGTWGRPMAYLPKRLDNVASGCPGWLRAVAAVALLVWEATKVTLGKDLIVKVLHEVNTLL